MIHNSSSDKSIMILDTTLRDGMQTPGIGCNLEKRIQIAREIAKTNVNIMEIGMPANPIDFEMIPIIAKEIHLINSNIKICVLIRCANLDVEKAKQVLDQIDGPKYVHLFLPTSKHLLTNSIGKNKSEVISLVSEFTSKVIALGYPMQFTPEDGVATFDRDFLIRVYRAAYNSGCRIFNVADTTGWSTTENFIGLIKDLKDEFVGVTYSCHMHNDSGFAVANTVAGVIVGINQVEGTVLGIGERAGNVDWMNVVVSLNQMHGITSSVIMDDFFSIAGKVGDICKINRPVCYPIVGKNSHRTSSGIHSKAVIGNTKCYHKLDPKTVGAKLDLVIGQTSGKHVISKKLDEIGLIPLDLSATIKQVLDHCMEHGDISDSDLEKFC